MSLRKWTIAYPDTDGSDIEETLTENDIIATYYPYWSKRMIMKVGTDVFQKCYTTEDCIQDWVVVHWAIPVKEI